MKIFAREGLATIGSASLSSHVLVLGAAASPGRATGRVRVIRDPANAAELQPGDVLVAPLTAPAWTPLFAIAAAVVTDIGSPMAHASIIAREYGVTVDGTAGVVEQVI